MTYSAVTRMNNGLSITALVGTVCLFELGAEPLQVFSAVIFIAEPA